MGQPGCGKTTTLFKFILDYKKENSKLKKKGLQQWSIYNDSPTSIPGVRLYDPNDLANYWPDRKSVLFIDEIATLWDSRNHKSFDLKISQFFKLHRHCECIVYAASQDFDCDKRIRQVCTEFVVLRKIFYCFCLYQPIKIIFPVLGEDEDSHGQSEFVSRYEFHKFWKWRLYFMPKYFKYFNTRELPYRPPMPYTIPVPEDDEVTSSSSPADSVSVQPLDSTSISL